MNFSKRSICWVAAILLLAPRFVFAQDTPAQSSTPPAASTTLGVDTIAVTPLEKRRQLLSDMSAPEREKFAEQFRTLPSGGPSNGKINALFMAWGAVDPAQAIESAGKLPSAETRRVAIEAICFGAKPQDSRVIAQAIKEFPGDALPRDEKERFLGMAIAKWSQVDPSAAAQFLAEVFPNAATRLAKPGAGDGDLLTTTKAVGQNWGAAAPQAALNWFKEKQQPENLVAIQGVIMGWWRKDAKAALAYVSAHVGTPNEREVAGLLSGTVAERDPRAAAQWVEWVKEERLRRRLRLGIAQVWAKQDAKAAGAWAKNLVGKEGEEAIGVVAGVWAFADTAGVEKWMNSLHGKARDIAIRGYVATVAGKNQKLALDWVMKMEDAQARDRLAKVIAIEWIKKNPEDSQAWIRKSKLSAADKEELLKKAIVR